jgi:hypothetical protein
MRILPKLISAELAKSKPGWEYPANQLPIHVKSWLAATGFSDWGHSRCRKPPKGFA